MVDCKYNGKRSDGVETCETFSTENYKLLQTETGIIYGSSVVDVIAGYDGEGKPYSRYHYTETDEKDEPESEEATVEEYDEALSELGVNVNDEA